MDIAAARPPYRKLVSVRRVSRIKNLDSSQTHEVAMVDGWPVVVGKGQFAANQQVLYFAIDCVLPLWDKRYESYRFSHILVELHGQKGWTVQTVKHEGHVSQGMVFAMDGSFPEITNVRKRVKKRYSSWESGARLAEKVEDHLMGLDLKGDFKIRKWIPFYPLDGGVSLGRSPSFLPATKFERFQNIPDLWKTHGDTEFQITEILDGMPMIIYDVTDSEDLYDSKLPGVIVQDKAENGVLPRERYGVSIGGHDYEETKASISWKAVREQTIKDDSFYDFLGDIGADIGLAGVLCGASIAGNPLMVNGHRFYVYAICDAEFKTWKPTDDHDSEWGGQLETLVRVPKCATRMRLSAFAKDLDELMTKAQGASFVSTETWDEYPSLKRKGLAFRALDGSFSFKVIANDWLLDETEKLRKAREDKIVSRPGPDDCV